METFGTLDLNNVEFWNKDEPTSIRAKFEFRSTPDGIEIYEIYVSANAFVHEPDPEEMLMTMTEVAYEVFRYDGYRNTWVQCNEIKLLQ